MNECIRFGVSLSKKLLKRFDKDISNRGYSSRSEAIRDLIRDDLVSSEWENEEGETAAALVLVYDHHQKGVSEHLTSQQHEFHKNIISTMHAHLDHDSCIEVILLRGTAGKIKTIADKLTSAKHIKLGRFVPATLGRNI